MLVLGKDKSSKTIWISFIVSFSVFLGYIVCYASIRNQIFPFSSGRESLALKNIFRALLESGSKENKENKEKEWFDIAFSGVTSSSRSFYPPAKNLLDIREFNRGIYFPRRRFPEAFNRISIKSHSLLNYPDYPPVSVIHYEVDGYDRKAFVYGAIESCPFDNGISKSVLFLIPGSGANQSLGAYVGNVKNYHAGIRDIAVENDLDFFVLIKPNEDFLAFTGGEGLGKLSYDFIVSYQYQIGGNYSTSYMIDALAVQKLLKKCYANTVFTGLSQGGLANLITSLYSSPTVSIVSSGYSLISSDIEWSGPLQIQMVTGSGYLSKLFDKEYIADKIKRSRTKFLFTWGLQEVGTYGFESETRYTASRLEALNNFYYNVGDYDHVFPVGEINAFLRENL